MNASTARFTPGRVAALVLIALAALGLGYLHFTGGSDSLAVPSGAQEDHGLWSAAPSWGSRPTVERSSSARTGTTRTRA